MHRRTALDPLATQTEEEFVVWTVRLALTEIAQIEGRGLVGSFWGFGPVFVWWPGFALFFVGWCSQSCSGCCPTEVIDLFVCRGVVVRLM